MSEVMDFLLSTLHEEVTVYQGYFALFIVSIIYLYCLKEKMILVKGMICFSIILIFLFCFFPFVYIYEILFLNFRQYFHLLWLLPVLPVFGFIFVEYLDKMKKISKKVVWILFCFFILSLAGSNAYFQSEWHQQGYSSRNPYKDEQIEICMILDAIQDGELVVAYEDFLPLIRQVSGDIKLLYGNDIETENYNTEVKKIYDMMQAEEIDMELLLKMVKKQGGRYMILPPYWKTLSKSLNELQEEGKLNIIYGMEHYFLVELI